MEAVIHTENALATMAREVLGSLKEKPHKGAMIVSLVGELGAGKTTFSKYIAKELGVEEDITSPTFVIEKIYALPPQSLPFSHFVHIDAYRLSGEDELRVLGWDRLINENSNLVFVEWADKVAKAIPRGSPRLTFEVVDDKTRKITWEA